MRYAHFALTVSVILHSQAVPAQELVPLSASTPQLAAVMEWHQALMVGNFAEFKRLTAEPQAQVISRNEFDEVRKWTPEAMKISVPRALPNGNFEITAVGCKHGRRQAAIIFIVASNSSWKVLSTGWGQVWGKKAKSCPM